MVECLILGDSIAQGISTNRTECQSWAQKGVSSYSWNNRNLHRNLSASTVVISLGTNDGDHVNTFQEVLALRQSVKAERVYWILPAIKPNVREIIKIVARSYEDTILEIPRLSKDHIHPTANAYQELAERTRVK